MTPTPDAILAQVDWVHRLARELVRDPDLARDLAQETCAQALAQPPSCDRNLRGWLGTVLRNLRVQSHRRDQRHKRWRESVARPEAELSTEEVVSRVQLHRIVVESALGLAPQYRSVILLRYFEDLTPTEISKQLKLPISTVKTQLDRGLKLLRERLDYLHAGNRRAWLVALIPLTRNVAKKSIPIGALLMKAKLLTVTAAIFLIGVITTGVALWSSQASAAPPSPGKPTAEARTTPPPTVVEPTKRIAVVLPTEHLNAEATPPDAAATPMFRGRVLDAFGNLVEGLSVHLEGTDVHAVSDATGHFDLPLPEARASIVADDAARITVLPGIATPGLAAEGLTPIVVVAEALDVKIEVTDVDGVAVAAGLRVALPSDFRATFSDVLDLSSRTFWTTRSTASGKAVPLRIPRIKGARIVAQALGFLPVSVDIPATTGTTVRLTLHRPEATDGILCGQVTDMFGAAVENAGVCLGRATTKTDNNGEFRLVIKGSGGAKNLVALVRGSLPACHRLADSELAAAVEGRPNYLHLRLGAAPLSVAGRVINSDGKGVPNAKVWPLTATLFGSHGGRTASIEAILGKRPQLRWGFVETDDQGDFVLPGLLDQEYTLAAIIPGTLAYTEQPGIHAGDQSVVLQAPTGTLLETVAGHVVSRAGQPLLGVRVKASRIAMALGFEGGGYAFSSEHGKDAVTNADGRFELHDVAPDCTLLVSSDAIIQRRIGVGKPGGFLDVLTGEVEHLRIEVDLRIHVRIELDDPELADHVAMLDDAGKNVSINLNRGDENWADRAFPILRGRSEVLTVTDRVTTVLLEKAGVVVRRIPITLIAGSVNVIKN